MREDFDLAWARKILDSRHVAGETPAFRFVGPDNIKSRLILDAAVAAKMLKMMNIIEQYEKRMR